MYARIHRYPFILTFVSRASVNEYGVRTSIRTTRKEYEVRILWEKEREEGYFVNSYFKPRSTNTRDTGR